GRGVRRHPRLYRQRAVGSLVGVAGYHRVDQAPVPAGCNSASLHASLQRGQDGHLLCVSVRAPPLSQHGGGRFQERPRGAQRPHTPRRTLCQTGGIHRHHSAPAANSGAGQPRWTLLQGDQPEVDPAATVRADARGARFRILGSRHGCRAAARRHGGRIPEAAGRVRGPAAGERGIERHPHRHHCPSRRLGGLVDRARPVPGGPQGPANPSARDESVGLVLASPALRAWGDRVDCREPVLAGPVPELQDILSLSRGKLRSGGGRTRALYRCRLPHVHSGCPRKPRRDAAHRHRIRARGAPPRDMNTLLQQGVTAQAEARPEAVALAFKSSRITYGALEETANRLARLLADLGCRRGDRIALLMPKMPAAIVSILGVLKADAIYVPLDAASPAARLARMLEVSECRYVLAAGPVGKILLDVLSVATLKERPLIGWMDAQTPEVDLTPAFFLRDLAGYPATAPRSTNTDHDVAHILFTSGSTGVPKGVTITHRNVLHFIRWAGA